MYNHGYRTIYQIIINGMCVTHDYRFPGEKTIDLVQILVDIMKLRENKDRFIEGRSSA